MDKLLINIDGKECEAIKGQTVLEVAEENDIYIPTLCYDERTKIYGSCGLCMVEMEGMPKLLKACATEVSPNMVITTKSERIFESRKTNLELLLSNHRGDCIGPCKKACPAHTDCQGYVGLMANGEAEAALRLIKERIPLPASIGRVCPHPCEDECRRKLVDKPISIANIKRAAGDEDLLSGGYIPEIDEESGKSVAVIGGGPFGLSLAYFLRRKGHAITVFEAMPKAGGMLRYGIPEYRLPGDVIDAEVQTFIDMGIEFKYNVKVGEDISFEDIQKKYDAIAVGIGAWVSTGTGAKGENAGKIYGGIDFLRKIVRNEEFEIGENVAVIGGGNTAMDCARSAVRLGAKKVYNIYRRTVDEMPADQIEIDEAKEEGVIFENLTNPIEYIKDKDGNVKEVKLQIMKLGEPDESGRRKPVPVKGKTKNIKLDTVLLAIGQAVDSSSLKKITKTNRKAIKYDPKTFMTNIEGVFAGGDCGNDKISIAVESIADAEKAAPIIDAYLNGEKIEYSEEYYSERTDITEKSFEDRERLNRREPEVLSPKDRKDNFIEVTETLSYEDAIEDSKRCLSCGCGDYFECKLIDYANEYDVKPERFMGDMIDLEFDDDHPFIKRDPNKCILCGKCVRACEEVIGVSALGLVERGFDAVVKPTLEKDLSKSGCISCGQCVSICPVGALQERLPVEHEAPLETEVSYTTCPHCSVGCSLEVHSHDDLLLKANPDEDGPVNKGVSCGRGKFGFNSSAFGDKLFYPITKFNSGDENIDYYDSYLMTVKKIQSLKTRYGKDKVALAISPRYTNEEIFLIKKIAKALDMDTFSFSNRRRPKESVYDIIGENASPNTIGELVGTELIIPIAFDATENPVINIKLKEAKEKGAKIITIDEAKSKNTLHIADEEYKSKNDVNFLLSILKEVIAIKKPEGVKGLAKISKDLKNIKVNADAKNIANQIVNAKKVMFVYQDAVLCSASAAIIANIALVSNHLGNPRDGILIIRGKNNSQGLIDAGIEKSYKDIPSDIKGLIIFGEDDKNAVKSFKNLEFIATFDCVETETTKISNVVVPHNTPMSSFGTYTNTERRLLSTDDIVEEVDVPKILEVTDEILNILEISLDLEDEFAVIEAMEQEDNLYKYSEEDEIRGGNLGIVNPTVLAIKKDGNLVNPIDTTDKLTKLIDEKLPTPVPQPSIL